MDEKAMYKLSYGLFVLTAKEDEKDNGCIINTAIQAASEPNQLSICEDDITNKRFCYDNICLTLWNISCFNTSDKINILTCL